MKKILLIASIALSINGFAQKVNGKLNFQKGQKLEMITETKKTTSMELMGQAMETTVNSTVTEVFDIEDANAASATIEHKIKRMVFTAEGMGNSQSFDSEKEEDRKGEMGKIMEKSLKNKYKMTVDAYGKITSLKADDDNPNATKNSEADAMAGLASTQLGFNLGLPKTGDASVFKILPAKEIAQGDTWTDSSSANGQKITTAYKVNSITATDIILDYTSDISINTTQQIMGTDASIKSDDKVTGQITLDKTTGLLKQKTAMIDSRATMEAQGMSIPSTGKTTVAITVKPS
jgi:hypothetical protein